MEGSLPTSTKYSRILGEKRYEMTNHLGNVLAVITDRHKGEETTADAFADKYLPDVIAYQDYDPYGMLLVERNYSITSENYRFGFNGYENTDELLGDNIAIDFGARVFDSRVARFFSVDPMYLIYPQLSTYCFAGNNPIKFVDYLGKGPIDPSTWKRVSTRSIVKDAFIFRVFSTSEIYAYTAYDKSLFWYGRVEQDVTFQSPWENLADQMPVKERYPRSKIKPGNEFVDREGNVTERYDLTWIEKSGYTKELAGKSGNYDYRTNTKKGFSITQVQDGIITYIANYKEDKEGLYYISSSTSYLIEKIETEKTISVDGQNFTYTQMEFNVTEVNYNSDLTESTLKRYSYLEMKPNSMVWINPNPINLETITSNEN